MSWTSPPPRKTEAEGETLTESQSLDGLVKRSCELGRVDDRPGGKYSWQYH